METEATHGTLVPSSHGTGRKTYTLIGGNASRQFATKAARAAARKTAVSHDSFLDSKTVGSNDEESDSCSVFRSSSEEKDVLDADVDQAPALGTITHSSPGRQPPSPIMRALQQICPSQTRLRDVFEGRAEPVATGGNHAERINITLRIAIEDLDDVRAQGGYLMYELPMDTNSRWDCPLCSGTAALPTREEWIYHFRENHTEVKLEWKHHGVFNEHDEIEVRRYPYLSGSLRNWMGL